MSQSAQPYRDPEASPIGQAGTRVQIQERQAWSISGWFGVLAVVACIAAIHELLQHSHSVIAIAIGVLAIVIVASLVIVQPGETKVVRFFGSYVGTVRRQRLLLDSAPHRPADRKHPGQEFRDEPPEGQRR